MRSLVGWLGAEVISLAGTRLSMIAIPWLVLTTTGSASLTGLVAFTEMAPYVVAKALGGPVIDRLGARRVILIADIASVVVVALVPLLHALDLLHLAALLAIVAVAGVLRGPGDSATHALVPDIAEGAGVSLERVTGLAGVVERLASTAGAALAAALVAVVGPATALVIDAASFGFSAALIALTAPRRVHHVEDEDELGYVARLHSGWQFLRGDAVLVAMVVMLAVTNLLDQAYVVVLVPVWAYESGHGVAVVGTLFACFSGAAVVGSVLATTIADRLPRFATYLVAFFVAGAPRYVALALDAPIPVVLAVGIAGGFAAGFINPILGAVIFERIPKHLMGRVSSLTTSLAWAGIPLGSLAGGALVAGVGISPALLLMGVAYLVATMLPAVRPQWRQLDRQLDREGVGAAAASQPVSDRTGG